MARMMDFRYQVPPTGKIFLVLVMVETLFLLIDRVILSYHIADLLDEPNALWWAGVMVINLAFFLHLSISAIKKESKYELLACVIVSFVLSLRVVGDFLWRQDHCQQDKLGFFCSGALIVVLLFQVLYIVLGYQYKREMGWHFYLTAGANLQIREAYEHYLLYYSLLKIDLQMIFMMMYTVLIVGLYERAYALLTCGVAIGVMEMLWVKKGLLAVRQEAHEATRRVLYYSWVSPLLYMILFLRFDALSHSHDNDGGGGSSGGADDTFISTSLNFPMLIVLFLAIVARFSLIYTLVLCYRNYGLGLKEKMFQHAFRRNQLGHTGARHRPFDHENTGGSGGIADGFGGELGLSADQYNYAYMREDGKTNNHYNNPSGLRLHFYQTSSSLSSFSPPMAPMRTNTANSGENLNHHQARTTKRGKHHYYNPFRNTKQYGVDSDDRSNGISLQPLGKSSEIKKRENNSTTGDNNNENMPMCSNNGAGPVLFIKNELTANDDATGKTCYHHTRNIHTDEGGITGNSNNDNDIYSNRSSSVQGDIFSVGTFGAVYSESLIGRHDHNNCNATVNTNSIAIDVNEANANDRDNKNKSMDASASHRDSDTSTTPSYFFTPSLPRPSLNSFSYNSTSQNLRFSVYTNDVDHTDNAQTHTDSSTCDV